MLAEREANKLLDWFADNFEEHILGSLLTFTKLSVIQKRQINKNRLHFSHFPSPSADLPHYLKLQ